MKASELRPGNYIFAGQLNGEEPITSYQIYKLELYQLGTASADYYKEIKPIPLTEEWLLRCGCNSENRDKFFGAFGIFKEGEIFRLTYDTPKVGTLFHDPMIRYVHQLQNLYFALTTKELIING